ncbi:methyltransferase [Pollutimonas subterranea]|uniref:Methyltransferase n=1 Tax=Pollutimonas subterranea TaxID=2045210 RepID=A0A2N4UA36_9BURK|nr:class I SAM-dependent methyltransferase [Pollutimonas subterranea]PLC51873.1 methyltransferase [Pollutimonas subterranea]
MLETSSNAEPVHVRWTENEQARSARWYAQNSSAPPKRIITADDTLSADAAYRLISQGTALLWRGDFQNARQLLQALTRRVDKRKKPVPADEAALSPIDTFNRHRLQQSQRSQLLNKLLIELGPDAGIALRRAPDVRDACRAALGETPEPFLLPLRALQGIIGAYEWKKKGVSISALGRRIHVDYGVFSPNRGEYIDLIARAPLPTQELAFDIGTGSGVLAAVLAHRGVRKVIATDQDPRALACAEENIAMLDLGGVITLQHADLFPAGRSGLIVCNPPWLPAKPTVAIERAIYDPDNTMLLGFLNGLASHLTPDGEGWLIMSDLAEHLGLRSREFLLEAFTDAGLRVIDRLDARPTHPKATDDADPLHAARSAETTSLWRLALH